MSEVLERVLVVAATQQLDSGRRAGCGPRLPRGLHLGCQGTPEKPDWIECEARREIRAPGPTRLCAARLREPDPALPHVRNPNRFPVATGASVYRGSPVSGRSETA